MEASEQLKSVLCDPEGNVCISGSDGDRKVISDALESLDQQVAALTEYNKTRTDELIAAGKQVSAQQAQMYEDRKQALVWRDQVAALTKERDVAVGQFRYVAKSNEKNFNDLAAAQARESKLREALALIYNGSTPAKVIARFALKAHTDDSALMERLTQEREKFSDIVWSMYKEGPEAMDEAIRSMK